MSSGTQRGPSVQGGHSPKILQFCLPAVARVGVSRYEIINDLKEVLYSEDRALWPKKDAEPPAIGQPYGTEVNFSMTISSTEKDSSESSMNEDEALDIIAAALADKEHTAIETCSESDAQSLDDSDDHQAE